MKIKSLDQLCNELGDGPSFSTFLRGKDALLKMHRCLSENRMFKGGYTSTPPTLTLTGDEITALFEVCTELHDKAFQFSA